MILLLGLLSAIGPFSIDMYLPGFSAIADDLHTSLDNVSYSLSSFFVGVCVGQLVIGPLLDRYGRRGPLMIGLVLYIVASIGCALSNSIELLIFWRFLQALGGCAGMVAPRAIIRDLFPVSESVKIFSLMILILGVSPIIAPTAGSLVVTHLGWHAVFIVLAVVTALILLAVAYLLPESKGPDPHFSLRPAAIGPSFWRVLKQPQFFTYAVAGGTVSAGLFAYLSGSPFVFMELYGLSDTEYSLLFGVIAAGLIISSQLNNLMIKRYSSERIIIVTMVIQSITGLVLAIGVGTGLFGLLGIIICIAIFLSCQGFSFPNASALSMAPFQREAGSASALMGAIQMALGAFASALVGVFNDGTALPLALIMGACAWIALLVLLFGRRKVAAQARHEDVLAETVEGIERM